ncbi:MAG: DUF2892 domain-containing protein [Pedobacter sp.]|nr:MAG: DUF2892 domain-containing protein [Pedobacter sp.]
MKLHPEHLNARSGDFSIQRSYHQNVGLSERLVSVFLGGMLLRSALKNPLKPKFLYGAYLAYRGFTGKCLVYDQLGIDARKSHAVNVRGEFDIDLPPNEVYSHWRNLNNLPGSIQRLLNVEMIDEHLSTWRSNVIGNMFTLKWEAEIVKDEPGRLIGWRSAEGSLFQHVGRVEFESNGVGGTKLKIVLSYHPPLGGVGFGISKVLNPYFEHLLQKEIKNFKYQIENKTPSYR